MPNKHNTTDLGVMDENNYAVIDGKKYPIKFVGRDSKTYQHLDGCLVQSNKNACCQCGALERTAKLYGVYVPGVSIDSKEVVSDQPFF